MKKKISQIWKEEQRNLKSPADLRVWCSRQMLPANGMSSWQFLYWRSVKFVHEVTVLQCNILHFCKLLKMYKYDVYEKLHCIYFAKLQQKLPQLLSARFGNIPCDSRSEDPVILKTWAESTCTCVSRVCLPAHFPLWLGSPPCICSPPAGPASSRPFPWSALSSPCSPPSRLSVRRRVRWNRATPRHTTQFPRKQELTCEHRVKIGTPRGQNHPVSGDLHVLRHYGDIAQQALAV